MSFQTMRRTVDCPYCGTGYTFKKEETFQAWVAEGRKDALHPACKQAKKEDEKRKALVDFQKENDRIGEALGMTAPQVKRSGPERSEDA